MRTDFRGLWILGGAWLTAYLQPPAYISIILLVILAVLFSLLIRQRHDDPYSAPWFTGPLLMVVASVSITAVGFSSSTCGLPEDQAHQRRVVVSFEDSPRVTEEGSLRGRATILRYWDQEQWVSCPIPIYLTVNSTLPPKTEEFESIVSLEPSQTRGTFSWWANTASAPNVVSWKSANPADHLKQRFAQVISPLPDSARALLPGMLYGDRSAQSEELSTAMKDSGLSHLTAVSGSNVALLGAMVLLVLRLLGVPRILTTVLLLAFLGLFVWFVGPDASVLRAGLMGAIAIVALMLGRGRGSLGILSLSGTILLLVDPTLAAEPAFALSMLATFGIIVLTPTLTGLLARFLPQWFAEMTAICCAAQFTCLPVIIALNSNFSLYSLPANLLVAPLLPLVTAVGVICLLLCTPLPGLVQWLMWLPGLPAEWIGTLSMQVVQLPGASRPWPEGAAGISLAAGFAVMVTVLVVTANESEHLKVHQLALGGLGTCLVLLAALVLPATLLYHPPPEEDWDIAMCDVGQGDGLVINVAPGQGWLIDAGPPDGHIVECLERLQIHSLPKVFVTHAHADHLGGIQDVEDSGISIGERYVSAGFDLPRWPQASVLEEGQSGGTETIHYEVLGPDSRAARHAEPNDTSLVIRFEFSVEGRLVSFFAAGDMEEQAMKALLRKHPQDPAQILKSSHHGARNGGVELIKTLRPQILLISAGKDNSYGHPHQEILESAAQVGARVIRTDQDGTVLLTFESDQVLATALGRAVR